MNQKAAHILVEGEVQGVGFRSFAQRHATRLRLTGYAKNLPDGRVEVEVEGDREKIEELIQRLRQGPSLSRVAEVGVSWKEPSNRFGDFLIAL